MALTAVLYTVQTARLPETALSRPNYFQQDCFYE